MKRKAISATTKRSLNLEYCANNPTKHAIGCKDYYCPLWKCNEGKFDESGYQIDHILEVTQGGTNDSSNLQVLCPSCHSVKTRRCSKQKWKYNSNELDYGFCSMEIESPLKKNKCSN